MTPPEYIHSPNSNKRRRLSNKDDQEAERFQTVPRLYTSPPTRTLPPQQPSPGLPTRSATTESWAAGSTRTSPLLPTMTGGAAPVRSPLTMAVNDRSESRPTLPSLPLLNFERESQVPRGRGNSSDDYQLRTTMLAGSPMVELVPTPYRPGGFAFAYGHPTQAHSLSVGAVHRFDRTPFSTGAFGPQFHDLLRSELSGLGMNGENRQRKRRGNLPKETTDKLRAWFHAHLGHPYPTEDEKQELMRQTGLQMSTLP
jgi:hypothetical protein